MKRWHISGPNIVIHLFRNSFITSSHMPVLQECILRNNCSSPFLIQYDALCWRRAIVQYCGIVIAVMCVRTANGWHEARIAGIRCGWQAETMMARLDGLAAQIPMKMLTKYARHTIQCDRIHTWIQKTVRARKRRPSMGKWRKLLGEREKRKRKNRYEKQIEKSAAINSYKAIVFLSSRAFFYRSRSRQHFPLIFRHRAMLKAKAATVFLFSLAFMYAFFLLFKMKDGTLFISKWQHQINHHEWIKKRTAEKEMSMLSIDSVRCCSLCTSFKCYWCDDVNTCLCTIICHRLLNDQTMPIYWDKSSKTNGLQNDVKFYRIFAGGCWIMSGWNCNFNVCALDLQKK